MAQGRQRVGHVLEGVVERDQVVGARDLLGGRPVDQDAVASGRLDDERVGADEVGEAVVAKVEQPVAVAAADVADRRRSVEAGDLEPGRPARLGRAEADDPGEAPVRRERPPPPEVAWPSGRTRRGRGPRAQRVVVGGVVGAGSAGRVERGRASSTPSTRGSGRRAGGRASSPAPRTPPPWHHRRADRPSPPRERSRRSLSPLDRPTERGAGRLDLGLVHEREHRQRELLARPGLRDAQVGARLGGRFGEDGLRVDGGRVMDAGADARLGERGGDGVPRRRREPGRDGGCRRRARGRAACERPREALPVPGGDLAARVVPAVEVRQLAGEDRRLDACRGARCSRGRGGSPSRAGRGCASASRGRRGSSSSVVIMPPSPKAPRFLLG